MDTYLLVKTLHIISATIVFGTRIGIATFMFLGHSSPDPAARAFAARITVRADFLFTLPGVIVQPLSGAWLIFHGGFAWNDYWLVLTYALYMLAGACWLPDSRALFVFDGVCVVCSGGASWIMRFDRRPKVNFTSMQGTPGRALYRHYGVEPDGSDLLIAYGRAFTASRGYLELCMLMGGVWHLLRVGALIPEDRESTQKLPPTDNPTPGP